MSRLLRALVALALIGSFVTACGDDDGGAVREEGATGSPAESPTGAASGTGTGTGSEAAVEPPIELEGDVEVHGVADLEGDSLEMEVDDFYFGPTFVKVEGSGTATIELENEGDAQHTFTIEGQDIDVTLAPGDSEEVDVELPESGHLEFICRFHSGSGMRGAFYVEG
jgi:plastocyanin